MSVAVLKACETSDIIGLSGRTLTLTVWGLLCPALLYPAASTHHTNMLAHPEILGMNSTIALTAQEARGVLFPSGCVAGNEAEVEVKRSLDVVCFVELSSDHWYT